MYLFDLDIKQSKTAYRADLAFYGVASLALAAFLLTASPREKYFELIVCSILGLLAWTNIEYLLHRFVLHGIAPFKHWHLEHHRHPRELIFTPTVVSGSLIFVLAFLPTLALSDLWHACAFTFGILAGYLAYTMIHHAVHHWLVKGNWMKQRKRWHTLHHQAHDGSGYYGVTVLFWDHVFGSDMRK